MQTQRRTAYQRVARLKSLPEVSRWLMGVGRDFRTQILLNLCLGFAYVAVGLLIVWATKLCVDIATGASPSGCSLLTAAALLIALMLSEVLLTYASRWIRALLGVRSKNKLQARMFRHLLDTDWLVLHHQHSGGLTNRLTKDVDDVSLFLSEKLPQLITSLAQFVGAFLFLFAMDYRLALVVVVVIPVMVVCAHIYMRRMRRYSHEVRNQEQDIQAFIQESVQHSLVLKTLEMITRTDNQLVESHRSLQALIRRNTRYSANALLIVNLSFMVGYLLAFFWGIYSLSHNLITFGAMLAFIQLVGQIQNPVRTLVGYVGIFITTFTAAERLIDLESFPLEPEAESSHLAPLALSEQADNREHLDDINPPSASPEPSSASPESSVLCSGSGSRSCTPPPLSEQAQEDNQFHLAPLPHSTQGVRTGEGCPKGGLGAFSLSLSHLSFSYPGGREVLHDLNASFPAGSVTALIGRTGSGKTTLISILLGLYKPSSGSAVAIDAQGNTTPLSRSTRHLFSYVPQGNTLFSGTIRQNLLLGNPQATDEQMYHTLHLAQADFVQSKPDGLDTFCSERGGGLSEGQAQRICIARALLRQTPVLLLDEAFSSLDSTTAHDALQAILRDNPNRTLIYITHRDALVPLADKKIVI